MCERLIVRMALLLGSVHLAQDNLGNTDTPVLLRPRAVSPPLTLGLALGRVLT